MTVIRCVACGISDPEPLRIGHRRKDGSAGLSRFCRGCARRPGVRREYRREAKRSSARESMQRIRTRFDLLHRSIADHAVILGPCRCHDCGATVRWNGLEWVSLIGYRHTCRRDRRVTAARTA